MCLPLYLLCYSFSSFTFISTNAILILMYWAGSNYTECNVDLDSVCTVCRCVEPVRPPKKCVYGYFHARAWKYTPFPDSHESILHASDNQVQKKEPQQQYAPFEEEADKSGEGIWRERDITKRNIKARFQTTRVAVKGNKAGLIIPGPVNNMLFNIGSRGDIYSLGYYQLIIFLRNNVNNR